MKLNWITFSYFAILATVFIHIGECLECYACSNQDSNKDKCVKTTKQCEEHHEVCITTVAWGLPPYWTPYGDRMHYVWKDCDTRLACQQKKADMNKFCKRDWFDDWSCIECCSGDLCNYYVTLGASAVQTNVFIIMSSLLLTLWIWK